LNFQLLMPVLSERGQVPPALLRARERLSASGQGLRCRDYRASLANTFRCTNISATIYSARHTSRWCLLAMDEVDEHLQHRLSDQLLWRIAACGCGASSKRASDPTRWEANRFGLDHFDGTPITSLISLPHNRRLVMGEVLNPRSTSRAGARCMS